MLGCAPLIGSLLTVYLYTYKLTPLFSPLSFFFPLLPINIYRYISGTGSLRESEESFNSSRKLNVFREKL